MATVTITFQDEDSVSRIDLSQWGTVTSRTGPAASATDPSKHLAGRQTVVVLNTGAITLAEVQRGLAAARRVRATAV